MGVFDFLRRKSKIQIIDNQENNSQCKTTKLILADPTLLRDSISVISDFVNEARFKITRDGLELVAMDPANVAIVIFRLLSSSFTEYDVEKEQEIAINLHDFRQILREVGASDILTLELATENKLQIQLKGGTTRTFNLPLIELEEKEQRVPNLTFPIHIGTSGGILYDAIMRADIVAESVTFAAEPDKFTISAEGDLRREHIEIKNSEYTKIKSESPAKIKAKYSIEYLKKMINAYKLANEVSIFFNQDYPLKLEYKIVDKLLLSFILAPRVENY